MRQTNFLLPMSFNLFMRKSDVTDYELWGSSTSLQIPFTRTENIKKSFSYDGVKLWNSLLKICVIRLLCQYLKVELVLTISHNIM
jgi:hypothetical protein